MFVPKSLGISSQTYGRADFYNDIQSYIRFKTPHQSLRALIDPKTSRSPLCRIKEALPHIIRDPSNKKRLTRVDHELRMFGCLARVNLRDRVGAILSRLESQQIERAEELTEVFLEESQQALDLFRAQSTSFEDTAVPRWLREVYTWVDEYASLMVELYLTELLAQVDKSGSKTLAAMRDRITTTLRAEFKYRDARGYAMMNTSTGPNEHFIYRSGQLKKFVTSVLFLDINKEHEGQRWFEIGAAVAAGVAMFLSTIAAIWSQQRYGLNSWAFVSALVIGYMFKDRIKDWMRRVVTGQLRRFLSDYKVDIVDPVHEVKVGRCHESFSFLPMPQIPDRVWAARHADSKSLIEEENKREHVLCYSKSIRIHSALIGELHGRLSDINDIIRFNVRSFIGRADDPTRVLPSYDLQSNAVSDVELHKLYHMNVVFVLKARGATTNLHRVRVVFDKNGIRRLDDVAVH